MAVLVKFSPFVGEPEERFGFFLKNDNSPGACKALVRRSLTRFRLPYITITPTFSICPQHGYLDGEHELCPKCDESKLAEKRRQLAA